MRSWNMRYDIIHRPVSEDRYYTLDRYPMYNVVHTPDTPIEPTSLRRQELLRYTYSTRSGFNIIGILCRKDIEIVRMYDEGREILCPYQIHDNILIVEVNEKSIVIECMLKPSNQFYDYHETYTKCENMIRDIARTATTGPPRFEYHNGYIPKPFQIPKREGDTII